MRTEGQINAQERLRRDKFTVYSNAEKTLPKCNTTN
jgi:hypothetical protein